MEQRKKSGHISISIGKTTHRIELFSATEWPERCDSHDLFRLRDGRSAFFQRSGHDKFDFFTTEAIGCRVADLLTELLELPQELKTATPSLPAGTWVQYPVPPADYAKSRTIAAPYILDGQWFIRVVGSKKPLPLDLVTALASIDQIEAGDQLYCDGEWRTVTRLSKTNVVLEGGVAIPHNNVQLPHRRRE